MSEVIWWTLHALTLGLIFLLAKPQDPREMRWRELDNFIEY